MQRMRVLMLLAAVLWPLQAGGLLASASRLAPPGASVAEAVAPLQSAAPLLATAESEVLPGGARCGPAAHEQLTRHPRMVQPAAVPIATGRRTPDDCDRPARFRRLTLLAPRPPPLY